MKLGDILVKIAQNRMLNSEELNLLRLMGNETQTRNSQVAGYTRTEGGLDLNLPFAPIYSRTLVSDVSSVTVDIPAGYSHLMMMGQFRTDRAAFSDSILIQFNGDTGTNYRTQQHYGRNATSGAAQLTSQTAVGFAFASGTSANANNSGNGFSVVMNYNSALWKNVLRLSGTPEYSGSDMIILSTVDFWQNTSPIRTIKFFPETGANIVAGSIISIYGLF